MSRFSIDAKNQRPRYGYKPGELKALHVEPDCGSDVMWRADMNRWKNLVWKNREDMEALVMRAFNKGVVVRENKEKQVSIVFTEYPRFTFMRGVSGLAKWMAFPDVELWSLANLPQSGYISDTRVNKSRSSYNNGVSVSPKMGVHGKMTSTHSKTGHVGTQKECERFLDWVVNEARFRAIIQQDEA